MSSARIIPLQAVGGPIAPSRPAGRAGYDDPAEWHRFSADGQEYLLVTNGSRVYAIDGGRFDALAASAPVGVPSAVLRAYGVPVARGPAVVDGPPLTAISLAVAQKCNLGCTYCYASEGDFGDAAQLMPLETARASVDRLFRDRASRRRVTIAFMGGEPLLNRDVIRQTTRYARVRGDRLGVEVGFAITSNGTLLTRDDARFFEEYGFAVTISIDGGPEVHDRLRPFKGGQGSYDRIMARVEPLLAVQRRMQVSARVSVTPENLDLRATLEHLLAHGFHSVGFSPVMASPTGRGELDGDQLMAMLERMIACGREFEQRVIAGARYAFANMVNAMREIHAGSARSYPCGAGLEYAGISARGAAFACHRFVNEPAAELGDVDSGIDRARQSAWLQARAVDRQEPCRSCWARYLCGGGCHHEVLHRGRSACEYVRGWLDYTLTAYARLLAARPAYFDEQPSP